MLRLIFFFLWPTRTPEIQDAEFDIEHIVIKAIERNSKNMTEISYLNESKKWVAYTIPCTLKKHDEFIKRFRFKIGLIPKF